MNGVEPLRASVKTSVDIVTEQERIRFVLTTQQRIQSKSLAHVSRNLGSDSDDGATSPRCRLLTMWAED